MLQNQFGEFAIRARAVVFRVEFENRALMTRRVGEFDALFDIDVEQQTRIRLRHFLENLLVVGAPHIHHRRHDAQNFQRRIQPPPHARKDIHQLFQAAHGKVFHLKRHDDGVGGGQRVHRQEIERRRTIQHNVFIRVANALQRFTQNIFAAHLRDELKFRDGEVYVGGQ
ncbi:MAG: hypothetical protein HDKAJFGB_02478 [Anaerolineae bacterium]|nr:hypothetical protein [Anaerolineae bacterium]